MQDEKTGRAVRRLQRAWSWLGEALRTPSPTRTKLARDEVHHALFDLGAAPSEASAAEQPPVDADRREARARELYERMRQAKPWGRDPVAPWEDVTIESRRWWCGLVDVIGEIERERHPRRVVKAGAPITLDEFMGPDAAPTVGLSEAYLAEVATRCAAATPGPWKLGEETDIDGGHEGLYSIAYTPLDDLPERRDATFIAHARADVPALLAEVDRLRAVAAVKVDELDAVLGRFKAAVGVVGPMPGVPALTTTEARALAEHIGIKLGLASSMVEGQPVEVATRAILGWFADRDPVWQAAVNAPVGKADELPPGMLEAFQQYTPKPKATRQPLTEAEARAWARWYCGPGRTEETRALGIAGALLAANRGDIPPEVRPKGTVMLNGGETEGPIDPLAGLRSITPHAVAALEYAAKKRGIGLNDVTDEMVAEDRTERLAGVPVTDLARAHMRPCQVCKGHETVRGEGYDRDGWANEVPCPACQPGTGERPDPATTITLGPTGEVAVIEERIEIKALALGRDGSLTERSDTAPAAEHPRDHAIAKAAAARLDSLPVDMHRTPEIVAAAVEAASLQAMVQWRPKVGDRVQTAEKLAACDTYRDAFRAKRRACAAGVVIGARTWPEGCYEVRHDDGTEAPYDESELRPACGATHRNVVCDSPKGHGGMHCGPEPSAPSVMTMWKTGAS